MSLARDTNRGAVREVAGSILGDLRSFTVWLLVLGIVVAVAAYLAGRPPWFGRLLDRAGTGNGASSRAARRPDGWGPTQTR